MRTSSVLTRSKEMRQDTLSRTKTERTHDRQEPLVESSQCSTVLRGTTGADSSRNFCFGFGRGGFKEKVANNLDVAEGGFVASDSSCITTDEVVCIEEVGLEMVALLPVRGQVGGSWKRRRQGQRGGHRRREEGQEVGVERGSRC